MSHEPIPPSEDEIAFMFFVANMTRNEWLLKKAIILRAEAQGRHIRHGEIGVPVPLPTPVYRVELGPNGNGPFNSGLPNTHEIYQTLTRPEPGWPGFLLFHCPGFRGEQMGITEEAFRRAHGHAAYGCNSLASVNTWFPPPSRSYLASLGAKLVHYQVPIGEYILQLDAAGEVVFNKATAIKVAVEAIDKEIPDALPLV